MEGERILWQGRPAVLPLAREALSLNWVLGYFAVLILWRVGVSTTMMPLGPALLTGLPFLALALAVAAILIGIALVQSRATVYTVTTDRVGHGSLVPVGSDIRPVLAEPAAKSPLTPSSVRRLTGAARSGRRPPVRRAWCSRR